MFFYPDQQMMGGVPSFGPRPGMFVFCPNPSMMMPMRNFNCGPLMGLGSRRGVAPIDVGGMRRFIRNPKQFKTVLCESWKESRRCNYGDRCQFAHGAEELRQPQQSAAQRHPKYRTQMCNKFAMFGCCPYGARCHFLHGSPSSTPELEDQMSLSSPASPPPSSRSGSSSPNIDDSRPSSTFSWPSVDSLGTFNACITAFDDHLPAPIGTGRRLPAFVELSQRQ
uniref:C3H1-type domain-containing protein n=1 Tax=Plectus sambesii TaxID=2011161 RepID=A0A914W6B7_9BILA